MLSDTEDADMAQAIVELQIQQTAYETSLATAARILQRSLMDFLR
jgi:flagellar hook-associated protein 3 FlgL